MKKLLLTLMILLSLFAVGCGNKSTNPNTTNNNTVHSQSFTGNFTFGTFGNASALSINEDGSIYMNMDNLLLTIKKEMVTKISDSQYTIKGQMPTIKYDNTSSAAAKSVMFAQSASDMNTVDVSLNLSGGSLSLSGQVNSDNVNANLTEVSGYIPSDYAGIYYLEGTPNTEIEIKSDGYVSLKRIQNGNTSLEQNYTDKLIKLYENEYLLNEGSLENNSLSSGQMTTSDAESILVAETLKYYNIYTKSTLKFENNIITMETKRLNIDYKDYNTINNYIQEIIKDISYTNQIDYSLITVKFENPESLKFIKK
ncbi:hypothetical protein BFL38_11425 [Brachyspira hampsonii]|uniref:Lipoprotein n=1 Tax=Brachyspira hampsonii TaxID=1287055 RepID=A0A1E5NIN2_9SPIR|nr:hypothetical protein [Brachyspira hampsonii]OEJ16059.1 hypothetical protein BFL38_11425 [Brachyspira hampsonii]